MPPKLALLVGIVFVVIVFIGERRRRAPVSAALLLPLLWYLVAASRPFGVWLTIWGIPVPGGGGDGGASDGSFVDRNFWTALMVAGGIVLARRPIDWGRIVQDNAWLVALFAFMLLSVLWSDYPYVSFKRFVKISGSVVMALVVLTERYPLEAVCAIIRRCAYIHLPMSIILSKYFRHLGVTFTWDGGAESWQGIATSKNTLGQAAMVAGVYFIWETIRNWREKRWKQVNLLYVLMAIYLLKGSDDAISLTSVSVFVFSLGVFLAVGYLRQQPDRLRSFLNLVGLGTVGLLLLVVVHSVVMFSEDSFFGWIITKMGRDITLTDRTTIWSQVYEVVGGRALLGVGYGGFWIGEMANIPFSHWMSWTLGQSHSGYVDTYLQLGWIGVLLLTAIVVSTYPKLVAMLWVDFERGRFFLTLFMTILFVNITETTFLRGDHQFWLVFLLATMTVPVYYEPVPVSPQRVVHLRGRTV